ncbi:MAG: hypothetical protein HGB10_10325 [Coriobacteriia bacterium]|nr:hypothetical protein [Coriobacteriia bacterium]
MSANGKLWTAVIVSVVVGAVVGAGAAYAMQQSSIAALNARMITADANTQAALQQIEDLTQQLESVQATQSATTTETTSVETTSKPTKKPAVKSVKQFTFIKKVDDSGSSPELTADYAQFLTGTAAAKAASAHGDESPPPNDYYIVNDNKLLRKLKVTPGIKVTVVTNADGTSDPDGHTVSFANWAANYASPTADNKPIRTSPYWITLKGSTVTKIEQQYLP